MLKNIYSFLTIFSVSWLLARILPVDASVDSRCTIDCERTEERGLMFVIEDSPEENAVCRPDGTIVVYSGMLKLFESEDELVAVVAHEMGHRVAGHKGAATPEKEREADEIGLGLMAKAGYDPNAAARFWERYYERIGWWEGDGSHEDPHERVVHLRRVAARSSTRHSRE